MGRWRFKRRFESNVILQGTETKAPDKVICQIVDGALIIKPSPKGMDFSDFILNDLIKEGFEAGKK